MNLVIETIMGRKSIRSYEKKPVPKDLIKIIIDAGNSAPCTMPFQSWRFVVVEDNSLKHSLVETIEPLRKSALESMKEIMPEVYENAVRMYEEAEEPKDLVFYKAPIIIYVIGPAANAIDCALCCENMMIAAASLGLGSCYVGFGAMVKANKQAMQVLELKEGERIYGPIIFGYPKEESKAKSKVRIKKQPARVKWV
ncbi:nitroreductase family protein [Candidatus Woesearchaeota archaeon]|nr:nitroreductase family protein [Candidatus Woesearchaeota archaeon]